MKREMLKSLGLEDEAIDKIMAEVGKDIEATKAKADKSQEIENLKNELATVNTKLGEANVQIEKFTGLDIEGIKKEADEWKNKYTEFETKSKADKEAFETQLKQQAYDFKLKEATSKLKFPNELTREAFENKLKAKNLPLENEKFLGFDDYVKEIEEQNPGMFVAETPINEPKLPEFTTPGTQAAQPKAKISLIEMMKQKNANPNYEPPIG